VREHFIAVRPQMLAIKDWALEASFVEEQREDAAIATVRDSARPLQGERKQGQAVAY
jgi:hypothetical protein